ncbi:MAG TPA: 2'-deoxycytidine 5'-triphosphate deaminase [Stellaceae bacterium]
MAEADAELMFDDSADAKPGRAESVGGSGVQPHQIIREYVRAGNIIAAEPIAPEQIQPASIDLRLGRSAYRVRASFLPGPGSDVLRKVEAMDAYHIDLSHGAVLETGKVYVIPLQESLALPQHVRGFANPKSTTGRLDVLTRLITDNGTVFDQIEPGYKGRLYLEVAPQTFSVVVRPGTRLNQVRFQRGTGIALGGGALRRLYRDGELARPFDDKHPLADNLIPVTIDLKGAGSGSIIGYRARRFTDRIDLDLKGRYDWQDYWEPIYFRKESSLTLNPGEFYILATREEVRVPVDLAAEMVAYETRSGEYRVHYAGFFDPGFGCDPSGRGSRAVLEVRSHDVPFILEHGQLVAWLRYEKMADRPAQVYGQGIGSNYQSQGLALAKQFKQG